MSEPLLQVRDLTVSFPLKGGVLSRTRGEIQAVAGVSFTVPPGGTLGLVGESGSGKSTTARAVVGLEEISGGDVLFDGRSLRTLSVTEWKEVRRDVQMVFQDPYAALHPRMTAVEAVTEAWRHNRAMAPARGEWHQKGLELLEMVGLNPAFADRYPNQFSGGQRQRIGIARALALRPRLLILDEPVSALDVSIQAQILNLLADLQRELGLAYLFIAHDLSVVHHISQEVAVMYLGKIVEVGPREEVYEHPRHPYTQTLLAAVHGMEPTEHARPELERVAEGDIPSPADPPSGCRFRTRCWKAQEECAATPPQLRPYAGVRQLACHFPDAEAASVSTEELENR